MIQESKDQSDREELLELINSDQFKKQFSQEILQSKNYQKLQEYAKWGLTDNVIKRREKLITEELAFWKERSPSCNLFLEKTHNMFWPILQVLSALRPISDEILLDFIAGWAMSRFLLIPSKLTKEQQEEINQLVRPSLNIFKEFISTQGWKEYLVNRTIPESSTITIKFSSCVEESVNTREVILSFIRDKKVTPFSKHQIEMLKMDYKEEQMRYVDKDHRKANESNERELKQGSGIFVPKINEEIIDELYKILNCYFEPEKQFENFLNGKQIEGKINFKGKQNKLAGVFIVLKLNEDIILGTHQQTFDFIKHTFLIKGKPIVSNQILTYLKDRSKAKPENFIDISI